MTVDLHSVAGKNLDVRETVDLLVVGAGPAGLAAAIEGAERGLSVLLVDEHPVDHEAMVESIPLHFGNRMAETVRNRNAMLEAMLEASPLIGLAFELGVDVRLGTACVGLYLNGENLNWMPGALAALSDRENGTILVRFAQVIVATGRRDMGLAFPGWEQPGVLGATAAVMLASRYGALDGRRALVLGSTAEAMLDAFTLQDHGIVVAGMIEQNAAPVGTGSLVEELRGRGIPLSCGVTVGKAEGTVLGGVERVTLTDGTTVECDLVVLAIGAVPVVDLLDAAGCRLDFVAARGGFVPVTGPDGATSVPFVRAVGDCAGVWPAKSADLEMARAEGRHAAAAAAAALGKPGTGVPAPPLPTELQDAYDIDAYRKGWVLHTVVEAVGEPHVCQCEEVTAREIVEVRPPRYLDWTHGDNRPRNLVDLLGEGPPEPDQIKRLTRAGMGPCQGRRCREQVQALLALQSGEPLSKVRLASYRAPVRPLPLSVAAATREAEDPTIRERWDSWFGMPRQWVPYWDVDPLYTVASLADEKQQVSE